MTGLVEHLVDAVTAGAATAAKDITSDAVRSAYGALKDWLGGRLSLWPQIERQPHSAGYRLAAVEELPPQEPALTADQALIERLQALQNALLKIDPAAAAAAEIDISRIKAGRHAVIEHLTASGPITVRDIEARQDVRISGVQAGYPTKNR